MKPRIDEQALIVALAGLPRDATAHLTDLDRALLDLRDARGLLDDCLPFLGSIGSPEAIRLHRAIAIACGALKGADS